jgi:hypothetical protein
MVVIKNQRLFTRLLNHHKQKREKEKELDVGCWVLTWKRGRDSA